MPPPASDLAATIPPAAAALLQQVTSTVAIAKELAASGREVDLAGLDGMAGRLCAQALDLPLETGAAMRPALVKLMEMLTGLRQAIQQAMP